MLALSMEDGGAYLGAATSATISMTLVVNLLNGERFELKDLFRAGFQQPLLALVRDRAFCDPAKTEPVEIERISIADDQQFYIKNGQLTLVYQRREVCAGAFGPTFVIVESSALRPLLNPNEPSDYLL